MRRIIQIALLLCLLALGLSILHSRKTTTANNQALQLMLQRRHQEAASLLEQAVAQRPGDARLRKNLAVAYDEMGLLEQAKASYEKSFELDGTQTDVRNRLSELKSEADLAQRALQRVERMKAEGWRNEPGVTMEDIMKQAEAHIQMDKHREAIILLERALFREPQNLELELMIEKQEAMRAAATP